MNESINQSNGTINKVKRCNMCPFVSSAQASGSQLKCNRTVVLREIPLKISLTFRDISDFENFDCNVLYIFYVVWGKYQYTDLIENKGKQTHYRPRVAQKSPGS